MRTLIFGLFGICMFGATVFLFVLLIRALLKYLRSGEVRKEKAETKSDAAEKPNETAKETPEEDDDDFDMHLEDDDEPVEPAQDASEATPQNDAQ